MPKRKAKFEKGFKVVSLKGVGAYSPVLEGRDKFTFRVGKWTLRAKDWGPFSVFQYSEDALDMFHASLTSGETHLFRVLFVPSEERALYSPTVRFEPCIEAFAFADAVLLTRKIAYSQLRVAWVARSLEGWRKK